MEYLPIENRRYVKYLYGFDCNLIEFYRLYTCANMYDATRNGYLEVVKYLHSIGHSYWTYMDDAAKNGHLEVVKYLYSIGATCRSLTIEWAASRGHLEVVKYLYSIMQAEYINSGEFDDEFNLLINNLLIDKLGKAMHTAASRGHLEMVKYLHSIGICCSQNTILMAINMGYLETTQFIIDKCMSISNYEHFELIKCAIISGNIEMFNLVVRNTIIHENELNRYIKIANKYNRHDITKLLMSINF